VSTAEEFYENAEEHFGRAETASERERAIFQQMAAAWIEVAQKWELGPDDRTALPVPCVTMKD
jgi:hypothetical protein